MRKFCYVAFTVVVALFGLTFSYRNHQSVRLDYYFGIDFEMQLPLLLFIAFALGLLIGCLATLPRLFISRRKLAKATKAQRQSKALQRADNS